MSSIVAMVNDLCFALAASGADAALPLDHGVSIIERDAVAVKGAGGHHGLGPRYLPLQFIQFVHHFGLHVHP